MKPKHFLFFCTLLFISSCCPSKGFFEEKFSENTGQISKIDDDLSSISSNITKTKDEISLTNDKIDSLSTNCCKTNEDLSFQKINGETFIGKAKVEFFSRKENIVGVLRFANSESKFTSSDGIIYEMPLNLNINRGDTVYFKVVIDGGIAYAKELTLNPMGYNSVLYDKSFVSFDLHSNYWHSKTPEHRYGHIKPKSNSRIETHDGYELILASIQYFRDESSPELSSDIDSIWVIKDYRFNYFPSNWNNPNQLNRYTLGFLTEVDGNFDTIDGKPIAVEFLTTHNH